MFAWPYVIRIKYWRYLNTILLSSRYWNHKVQSADIFTGLLFSVFLVPFEIWQSGTHSTETHYQLLEPSILIHLTCHDYSKIFLFIPFNGRYRSFHAGHQWEALEICYFKAVCQEYWNKPAIKRYAGNKRRYGNKNGNLTLAFNSECKIWVRVLHFSSNQFINT